MFFERKTAYLEEGAGRGDWERGLAEGTGRGDCEKGLGEGTGRGDWETVAANLGK